MNDINIATVFFGDGEPPDELSIRFWEREMRRGKAIPMPTLMRKGDVFEVIDGRARLVAARRCGVEWFDACVVPNLSAEKALALRADLNRADRLSN